jgi:Peptidase family M28
LVLLAAALAAGCNSRSREEPPPRPTRITERGLTAHLGALQRIADRSGGTRAVGTPGFRASVDYVAHVLRDAGWRVRVQQVPLLVPSERTRPRLAIAGFGRLRPDVDFETLSYSGAGAGRGVVRRVGNGCSPADFAGLRAGEVALAAEGRCFFRVQAANARRAGAAAMLASDGSRAPGVTSATLAAPAAIPALILRRGLAERIRDGAAASFRVDAEVRRGVTWNVIADAGQGPRVAMAGAHLDSVPDGPGIDDNGSGVAALLEVARVLGPAPGVRLAFWGGEELGLVGSRYYVRTLSRSQRRAIAAYVNLDMVGSPNPVPSVYAGADPRLTRLLRRAHRGREIAADAAGRSDHAPFQQAGIPVAGLYTGDRDPCYHRPCDTLAGVNRPVLLGMAQATLRALRELAAR